MLDYLQREQAMLEFVINKHKGHQDKGGAPYIVHLVMVASLTRYSYPEDSELYCIALGHDLFEDTDATPDQLKMIGMTDRIIDGIHSLTKRPGEKTLKYRAKVSANSDAVKVKKSDLIHNMQKWRVHGWTPSDEARHWKYMEFYDELSRIHPAASRWRLK